MLQQTALWWCDKQKMGVSTVGCCGKFFVIHFSEEIKINTFSPLWFWGLFVL